MIGSLQAFKRVFSPARVEWIGGLNCVSNPIYLPHIAGTGL